MILVRLLHAVKMDSPHRITGNKGAQIALDSEAANWAVMQGLAEDTGSVIRYDPAPGPGTLSKIADPKDPLEPEGQEEADEEAEPPKRPYGNAPKSAWVEYACAVDPGLTAERAEDWTKADLMSRYGERL